MANEVTVTEREAVLAALADGPMSSDELGVSVALLREMEADGEVKIDPDMFPDRFVPGNPFIARLPECDCPWPGWKAWNL